MFRHHDDGAPPPSTYQMHQRMFSIGDDFWIENGAGQQAFKVDGKALRLRKTLELQGPDGALHYRIREKLVSIRDVMEVEGPTGTVATVKKALISPLRERYDIHLADGSSWKAQGNIVDHEYEIEGPAGRIAEVGKKWFRVRDTYGIQVVPGHDDALVLAIAIVIDQMAHAGR